MAISTRATWTEADYYERRYQLIKLLEESNSVSLTPYVDTRGIPTIGLGFNIIANIDAILIGMGVSDPQGAVESLYRNRIINILTNTSYANMSALQAALDRVMSDRASDPAITGTKRTSFSFASETEVKSVFTNIVQKYDDTIVQWEKKYGISPDTATAPSLQPSPELLVLFSLSYNNANKLLGGGLANAMLNGNRAEAWYEIRYHSNQGLEPGVAKRRYIESEVFGLYGNSASITNTEAQDVYAMLTKHRADIYKQEALFGVTADGQRGTKLSKGQTALEIAQADSSFVMVSLDDGTVDTLFDNLTPARDTFIAWVNTQLPAERQVDAAIINPAAIYFRGNDTSDSVRGLDATGDDGKGAGLEQNVLVGNDRTDILIGGAGDNVLLGRGGNDTLEGGTGDDELFGGAGNDILRGGKDGDILYGGTGDDVYIWKNGDGNDTIVDPDGGRLIINDTTFKFAGGTMIRDGTSNVWRDPSGNVVLTHNSPWRIELPDGSVIQLGEDFDPAQWGINLQDDDEPTRTYSGDQRALLRGIEIDQGVVMPGDPAYNTYKWGATSWDTDGTLNGGVAEVDFNDVIDGSAGNDRIDGNDALDIAGHRTQNMIGMAFAARATPDIWGGAGAKRGSRPHGFEDASH